MKTIILAIILTISNTSLAKPIFTVNENERIVNRFNIDKDLITSFGIYKDDQLSFNNVELWNRSINDNTVWLLTGHNLYTPFDSQTWHSDQTFGFYFSTFSRTYRSTVDKDNFNIDYKNKTLNLDLKNNFGNKSSVIVSGVNMIVPEPHPFALMLLGVVLMAIRFSIKNK